MSLISAAEDGRFWDVIEILNKGVDINRKNCTGRSALHEACYEKHIDIVRLLCAQPTTNMEIRDGNGQTPLSISVDRGVAEACRLLLENGANPNQKLQNGNSLLHIAVQKSRYGIARLLLQHGARPTAKNSHGRTPRDLSNETRMKELLDEFAKERMSIKQKKSRVPVTVLCGMLGSGKTTLLNHLLKENQGKRIAVIVNDMSEVNIDAKLISRAHEKLVELSNGCICCSLREDLLTELKNLASSQKFDYVIIESSGISEPLPIAETFSLTSEEGDFISNIARLDTMVTVVDAKNFLLSYQPEAQEGNISRLLHEQVEFCNVIILNKTDLMESKELQKVEGILRTLNHKAKIVHATYGQVDPKLIIHTGLFDMKRAAEHPGWLAELRGEHTPETQEYGISHFIFKTKRFFNKRLLEQVPFDPDFSAVVRMKGFVWLNTCPPSIAILSQAGKEIAINLQGGENSCGSVQSDDEHSHNHGHSEVACTNTVAQGQEIEQELVVIGVNMDREKVSKALLRCCA